MSGRRGSNKRTAQPEWKVRRLVPSILLVVILACIPACKQSEKGLQQVLKDKFLSKGGSSPAQHSGKSITPSKSDLLSQKNAIQSCPDTASIIGSAFPRGKEQFCSYKDDEGKGVRHGEYRTWYPDGQLRIASFYEDGELQGTYTEWYPDGQLREKSEFDAGARNGVTQLWDKAGTLVEKTEYKNGEKNGVSVQFNSRGEPLKKGTYQGDLEHGTWELYGRHGKIKEKTQFAKGFKHGRTQIYDRNGKLRTEGFLDRGVKIGHWIQYQPRSGAKKNEGNYLNSKKHGRWIDYSRDGKPLRTTFYDQGRKLDSYKMENRAVSGREGAFGSTDILGAEPPRARPKRRYAPERDGSEKAEHNNSLNEQGWKPL